MKIYIVSCVILAVDSRAQQKKIGLCVPHGPQAGLVRRRAQCLGLSQQVQTVYLFSPEMVLGLAAGWRPVLALNGGSWGFHSRTFLRVITGLCCCPQPTHEGGSSQDLIPKPFFSEVWLLYALPPGLTQASSEKSVLVRHHHGSCLGEPVLSEETVCLPEHSKGLP